jgi:hypothetical protein
MSSTGDSNPKKEILQDAIKELKEAKRHLKEEKGVSAQYAKNNVEMALRLLKGMLSTYEIEQGYHLD